MKKVKQLFHIVAWLLLMISLTACSVYPMADSEQAAVRAVAEEDSRVEKIQIAVGDQSFAVTQYENEAVKSLAEHYVKAEIPQIKPVPSQATYLLWLDCTKMPVCATEAAGFIREKNGLYLSAGSQFGGNGQSFLRMNIACPRTVAEDGLLRLKQGAAEYEKWITKFC